MQEGQFMWQGVTFGGKNDDLIITSADLGDAEMRTNDAPHPVADGLLLGRDRLGGATWTFNISTNTFDSYGAYAAARSLSGPWRSMLNKPGAKGWLSFNIGGQERKVLGRPRRVSQPQYEEKEAGQGLVRFVAEFILSDPFIYYGDYDQYFIQQVNQPTDQQGAHEFITEYSTTYVEGEFNEVNISGIQGIFNDGQAPVPYIVTLNGPLSYPTILVNDHHITLEVFLNSSSDQLVIDSRANTARVNGALVNDKVVGWSCMNGRVDPGSNIFGIFGDGSESGGANAIIDFTPADHTI